MPHIVIKYTVATCVMFCVMNKWNHVKINKRNLNVIGNGDWEIGLRTSSLQSPFIRKFLFINAIYSHKHPEINLVHQRR